MLISKSLIGNYQEYTKVARSYMAVLDKRLQEGTSEEKAAIKSWLAEWKGGKQMRKEQNRKRELEDEQKFRNWQAGRNNGGGWMWEVTLANWCRKTFAFTD